MGGPKLSVPLRVAIMASGVTYAHFGRREAESTMYDRLFSPVRIGSVEIKNRVATTPTGVNLAAAGGGGPAGFTAAMVLQERGFNAVLKAGHTTTVVDMLPQIGAGANMAVILDLEQRMAPYAPACLPGHKLSKITAEGVELECVESGVPGRTNHRRRGAWRADRRGDAGRLREGVRV